MCLYCDQDYKGGTGPAHVELIRAVPVRTESSLSWPIWALWNGDNVPRFNTLLIKIIALKGRFKVLWARRRMKWKVFLLPRYKTFKAVREPPSNANPGKEVRKGSKPIRIICENARERTSCPVSGGGRGAKSSSMPSLTSLLQVECERLRLCVDLLRGGGARRVPKSPPQRSES